MRPDGTLSGISVAAVAAVLVLAAPIAATASTHSVRAAAKKQPPAGVMLGGTTSQEGPIMLEMSKDGRSVVRMITSLRLPCASGGGFTTFDGYVKLGVKGGRFSASFGPQTVRHDDGTTSDFEGSVSGTINRARSKAGGRWQLKETDHDGAGAMTDTCDSGSVTWSAKQ